MKNILIVVFVGVMIMVTLGQARTSADADLAVQYASSGWIEDAESRTWTYSSADSPTFIASVNDDMTNIVSVGYRVRLKQSGGTYKYFGVTAVGSYSDGATLITLYGGTDYTLANETITNPAYSPAKVPLGFPTNPDKWTVEVVDTSTRTQATPSSGTWYNIGTTNSQITIPIGIWNVSYQVLGGADLNSLTTNVYITLSTANNSESNSHMTSLVNIGNSSVSVLIESRLVASDVISLSSKTLYYLNAKTGTSGVPNLYFGGATTPTIIRAVWAGL